MPADRFHAVKALSRNGGISGELHFSFCTGVFISGDFCFKENYDIF
jgi:hypothetical protein